LVFDDQRRFSGPQGPLAKFIQTFCLAADDYGMQVERNPVVSFGNGNATAQRIQQDIDELYARITRQKNGPPELLMFAIKGKSTVVYEIVKQYSDTVKGVQSQAMDSFNVIKKGGDRSYHANLLLKVNSKLGGTTVSLNSNFTDARVPTVITF